MTHLNMTPWTRDALTPDEVAGIHARAAALGAYVSVNAAHPGGPYDVHISDRAVRVSRRKVHHLPETIWEALDEFRSEREAVDADVARYTPEELVTIAEQSGIAVSRG